jgi:hypothetical protein
MNLTFAKLKEQHQELILKGRQREIFNFQNF